MPDDEKSDPVAKALDLLAKHASENQAKDAAAYAMVPSIIQSMSNLVKETRRSEISLEDVERAVEAKTADLANQQSVCDLKKAFDETFGWLRGIVERVKRIPNWILWIAALCTIFSILGRGCKRYLVCNKAPFLLIAPLGKTVPNRA